MNLSCVAEQCQVQHSFIEDSYHLRDNAKFATTESHSRIILESCCGGNVNRFLRHPSACTQVEGSVV